MDGAVPLVLTLHTDPLLEARAAYQSLDVDHILCLSLAAGREDLRQ
jgi:hypothetical protein